MGHLVFPIENPELPAGADPRALLGGKGAGLVEMVRLGIPVPPAFVISTEAFARWREQGDTAFLDEQVSAAIASLERQLGRRFGDPENPLVVSVRSGAAVSMPGMMDTILNLGLNDACVGGLARQWSPQAAQAALARLRHSYAEIVGTALPQDPRAQLDGAVAAVFASWDSERARTYRARGGISDSLGTAVTVQAMVFGTAPGFSGTGVLFTRHPSTGEAAPMGDWLRDAQGEDVVAGTHQTEPLSALAAAEPALWDELMAVAARLEQHQRDMCDIEFTIESGRLWILQYRRGKRSPLASVRIATELAADPAFAVSRDDALLRVRADELAALLAERSADAAAAPIATGLGASPGIATGKACFSVDAALDAAEIGDAVILVRPETSPEDIPGMDVSEGILTSTGGLVSHAAIVAREWGKPAVVGAAALVFGEGGVRIGEHAIAEGDELSIDGASGAIFLGKVATSGNTLDPCIAYLVDWARERAALPEAEPEGALQAAQQAIEHTRGAKP